MIIGRFFLHAMQRKLMQAHYNLHKKNTFIIHMRMHMHKPARHSCLISFANVMSFNDIVFSDGWLTDRLELNELISLIHFSRVTKLCRTNAEKTQQQKCFKWIWSVDYLIFTIIVRHDSDSIPLFYNTYFRKMK